MKHRLLIFLMALKLCLITSFAIAKEGSSGLLITEPSPPQIVNDRMFFTDEKSLNDYFHYYADVDEEALYNSVGQYYHEHFLSLRPPVTENNEEFIQQKLAAKHSSSMTWTPEAIISTEELIGDDTFAAMLNHEGEIQVGNKVYKYTDAGLFFIESDKYEQLLEFLTEKKISKSPLQMTDSNVRKLFLNENLPDLKITKDKKLTLLKSSENNDISFFAYPGCDWASGACLDGGNAHSTNHTNTESQESDIGLSLGNSDCPHLADDNPSGVAQFYDCVDVLAGTGTSGTGPSGTNTAPSPLDGLEEYVEQLQPCNASSGLFGNIFGVNRYCYKYFESAQRVKTKAFNYDYFLVYHTGLKVKHQHRPSLFWKKQTTDVVALGGSKIQFDYSVDPVANPASLNQLESIISEKSIGKSWRMNANFYANPNSYSLLSESNYSGNTYPNVFDDDLTVETFGDNGILDSYISQNYQQGISAKLHEYFWANLRNGVRNAIRSASNDSSYHPPLNTTLIYKSPEYGKLYVQKSYSRNCFNCKKVEKTIDFGFLRFIGIGNDDNGDWNIYVSPDSNESNPQNYSVSVFGVAKRNGAWHGSLIEF